MTYQPAIQNPIYQPAMRIVTNITNAFPAAVTTSFPHQYGTGLLVRLNVPQGYGMTQVDKMQGYITVTGAATFTINIDTRYFDAFATPTQYPYSYQNATVVPFGEQASMIDQAVRNVLPYENS